MDDLGAAKRLKIDLTDARQVVFRLDCEKKDLAEDRDRLAEEVRAQAAEIERLETLHDARGGRRMIEDWEYRYNALLETAKTNSAELNELKESQGKVLRDRLEYGGYVVVVSEGTFDALKANGDGLLKERDYLCNLIKKYVRHVQDCEGVHYIDSTDDSGRSSLTEEEQKMLLKIAAVREDY